MFVERIALTIGYSVMAIAGLSLTVFLLTLPVDWLWNRVKTSVIFMDLFVMYVRHGRKRALKHLKENEDG